MRLGLILKWRTMMVILTTLTMALMSHVNTTKDRHGDSELDYVIKLNELLRSEKIYESFTLHNHRTGLLKFHLSSNLMDACTKLNINLAQFKLKSYANAYESLVFSIDLNLTLNVTQIIAIESATLGARNFNESDRIFCYNHVHNNSVLIKSCYELYEPLLTSMLNNETVVFDQPSDVYDMNREALYQFKTLSFKFQDSSLHQMCMKLVKRLSDSSEIYFFAENMCYTMSVKKPSAKVAAKHGANEHEKDGDQFQYKPLFIVLMYILCATILISISIAQHFINKFKLRKIKKNMDKLKQSSTNIGFYSSAGGASGAESSANFSPGSKKGILVNKATSFATIASLTNNKETQPLLETSVVNEKTSTHELNQTNDANKQPAFLSKLDETIGNEPVKKVLFHVNSVESVIDKILTMPVIYPSASSPSTSTAPPLNDSSRSSQKRESLRIDSAEHILSDKPWARTSTTALTTSLLDTRVLKNSPSFSQQFYAESPSPVNVQIKSVSYSSIDKFNDNGVQPTSQASPERKRAENSPQTPGNLSKSKAIYRSNVIYESNV